MSSLEAFLDALAAGTGVTIDHRAVLEDARRSGHRPIRALSRAGVPLAALEAAAWSVQGFPRVEVAPSDLAMTCMRVLPLDVCAQACAIVVARDGPTARVAIADPTDVEALDLVRGALGGSLRVEFVVAEREAIEEAIRRYTAGEMMGHLDPETIAPVVRAPSLAASAHDDSQAARNVAAIITYAVNAKASDVHAYCDDAGAHIRIRIDGVLHPYTTLSGVDAAAGLLGRIKVLGGLDLGQRRLPQDGRIQVEVDGRVVDIRLATLPNVWGGEDAVLRILDTAADHVAVEALGLSTEASRAWSSLWNLAHGLVLVAGPTGSGKSTSLYATLRELATPDRAIRTVEDPVEVRIPGITQVQVHPRAGLSFVTALRSFLRSDPDVILIGEIRDRETAQVATEAAITGHLVLATLHTASAAQVPLRLLEMGVPSYLVAAALRGAMAQRLIRRLCRHCSVASPDAGPAREAGHAGCPRCAHTGYRGRMAVAEVMVVNEQVRRAIAELVSVETMGTLAVDAGMIPIAAAAMDLVMAGGTSLAERARVTAGGE